MQDVFSLPNGHKVSYQAAPDVSDDAYIMEIRDGKKLVGRYCSCNGVSMPCPEGKSPSCNCTTNPPSLSCV